jgi:hypothetical protein
MAMISDGAKDALLDEIRTNVTTLYICNAEPGTYAQASSTYALGSKSSPTIGTAGDASPNGRKVTVSAITDGTVSATDTASHWALTSGSVLYAAGSLSSSQSVTSGNTFTLTSFDIRVPDVA